MRRTLEFLKWKSASWLAKAPSSTLKTPPTSLLVLEGLTAYTFRQAEVFISLHDHFLSLWHGFTAVDGSDDQPTLIPMQGEDEMQGVDGGDI